MTERSCQLKKLHYRGPHSLRWARGREKARGVSYVALANEEGLVTFTFQGGYSLDRRVSLELGDRLVDGGEWKAR